MKSRIYSGQLMHSRLEPVKHAFTYPAYTFVFDLDELPNLQRHHGFFGYNRFRLFSLYDKDYVRGRGPIRQEILKLLEERGCADGVARIELVTLPRHLGYVFNPVSFYYAYRADGSVRCIAAEVHNTFSEKHFYVLDKPLGDGRGFPLRYEHAKEFHVSPFNDLRGGYDFSFSALGDEMDIRVDLIRDGRKVLLTQLTGTARPFTRSGVLGTVARRAFSAVLNMPRIVLHAVRLHYGKKLPVFHKPPPSSPMTIPAPPARLERVSERAITSFLSRIRRGELAITMPDGSARLFRGTEAGRSAAMMLRSYRPFWRILKDGDVGFGESYVDGEWDSQDLTGLISLFIDNADSLNDRDIRFSWVGRVFNRVRHELRRNSLLGSRRNIEAHYDLGNDLYQAFLDAGMMYSCALYARPEDTLEEAQMNKLHAIIDKAQLGPEHHVLEIGCGWGSFAVEAVRTTGCRVTGITLSQRQLELARQRVKDAGLEDRISFELCDYRHVRGRFDRIVSIEMLEAVGHEYLGTFFAACDRVLAPDGLVVLQVITIPDQRYDAYRRSTDWTQKHIFPGGVLPSLAAMSAAMTRHSRFVVESLENIGPHYAPTLREWRRRFENAREDLLGMGYDEAFQRKFRYYFCYCEAGFATRTLNDLHLVLTRPHNPALRAPPVAE